MENKFGILDPLVQRYYNLKTAQRVKREVELIQIKSLLSHPFSENDRQQARDRLQTRERNLRLIGNIFAILLPTWLAYMISNSNTTRHSHIDRFIEDEASKRKEYLTKKIESSSKTETF